MSLKRFAVMLLLFLICGGSCQAADLSKTYDSRSLNYWHDRYEPNLKWNFENLIMNRLTPEERKAVGKVTLRVPLASEGAHRGNPLVYYSTVSPPEIVIPTLSVKFLDDLSIASAWLEENGYTLDSVMRYLGMLKYQFPGSFPGVTPPAPLTALKIPSDALKNKNVDETSQKILKSAIAWIMAHELAHVRYKHSYGNNARANQQQEIEADSFATEIFRRNGVAPIGTSFYFFFESYLAINSADFPSQQKWEQYIKERTHPLTPTRLKLIAENLQKKSEDFTRSEDNQTRAMQAVEESTQRIRDVSGFLADPMMQKGMRAVALSTDNDSLQPKRPKDLLVVSMPTTHTSSKIFDGAYSARYGHNIKDKQAEQLEARVVFVRQNDRVHGRYTFGLGEGTIEGIVKKEKMYFDWNWGGMRGKGVLFDTGSGHSFTGTWGTGESTYGGGTWTGSKES